MKGKTLIFIKKVKEIIKRPEMRILPGQLSFFLLLSIIPLVAVIGVVASTFSLSIESLIQAINNNLPEEISSFLVSIIDGKSININIIIFCISAFILASNGPHSMIIGANLIYKVDDKDFLTRRIKALLMTIVLVILFTFVLIVPAFGDKILAIILDFIPNSLDNSISLIYYILKYPISLFFIYFFIKLLYTMAPDKTISSSKTTSGAIFTTLGWIVSTEIYSFYVNYFAHYNLLYGSVANLIILFLWIYLLSYIFVLGMIFNASGDE